MTMKLVFRIQRFNPESDAGPHMEHYPVDALPDERVLDVLLRIKDTLDSTLTFRRSCGHGVCGSDAMRINGVERLACKTLIKDVAQNEGATVLIEPLQNLALQRDLNVDQELFFKNYRAIKPFLIPTAEAPEKEYVQSEEARAKFDGPTKCILCAACFSACPVLAAENPDFIGPAALANGARFVFDDRDQGLSPRMDVLDKADGAWACQNHFECTRVCPRGIKVTKEINQVKRAITALKEKAGPHEAA